jgi:hypothetical protein
MRNGQLGQGHHPVEPVLGFAKVRLGASTSESWLTSGAHCVPKILGS